MTNTENISLSIPPSHCLEDGRFVFLPPPNAAERSNFFERSIDRHGLLQSDMDADSQTTTDQHAQKKIREGDKDRDDDKDDGITNNDDKTRVKVHPLAVASARLQSNGLNELNRAINLATLVSTGDFFSYTNVVDPSFESDATGTMTTNSDRKLRTNDSAEATTERTEALFSLKRKRAQFEKASQVLQRHERRIWAGIQAQHVIDRRLFQLRQQWRLVAPEHGTRARLHAARTNEIIAVDVDVYDRDRVHDGSQALIGSKNSKVSLAGRLASRVPRFATIELQDNFKVKYLETSNVKSRTNSDSIECSPDEVTQDAEKTVAGEGNNPNVKNSTSDSNSECVNAEAKIIEENHLVKKFTRAEPYAVADPTLGRVMENFDPSKIPMLNLQLDIQKSSTGFTQSACLEPMTTLSSTAPSNTNINNSDDAKNNCDEELLISLQHSLFCANIFESMRNELDTDNVIGKSYSRSPARSKASQRMAWLASESEENYLAPPSFLVGSDSRLSALSVVHCHEGEVKVQLDSEYQLCLKLVEANAEETVSTPSQLRRESQVGNSDSSDNSGSQSPRHLHAFCRALLLHAQNVYHRHSLYLYERGKKKRENDAAAGEQRGLARIKKEDVPEPARILQHCVSLGSKMLFEQRIRKSLLRVSNWLIEKFNVKFTVEWLSLSLFDLHSKFTICCGQLVIDGLISRDKLTVTRIDESEAFRKAHFHTEKEFEIYLKLELRRQI